MAPLNLAAECLWSRHGFGDGAPFRAEDRGPEFDDVADPMLDALYEDMDGEGRHDVLELLVHRHLVPVIAAATGEQPQLVRIRGGHNQIRDVRLGHGNERDMPDSWRGLNVDVSEEQILDAMAKVKAARLAKTPS